MVMLHTDSWGWDGPSVCDKIAETGWLSADLCVIWRKIVGIVGVGFVPRNDCGALLVIYAFNDTITAGFHHAHCDARLKELGVDNLTSRHVGESAKCTLNTNKKRIP